MASDKTSSKTAVIERWQAGTIVRKTDETGAGPIGSLFNSLIELLGLILIDMKLRSNVSEHYRSLESSSAALFFWGMDFNVSQGELDEALRDSPELRDTCLMVLASIAHFTTSFLIRLVIGKSQQKPLIHSTAILASLEEANNILDQPYYPTYKLGRSEEEFWHTLRVKIDSLIILGPSLASPAEEDLDDQEPRTVEYIEAHLPEQAFINSIAQRFPQAAPAVVTRLGKLNWERYDHMLRLQRTSNQQELEPSALEKARTIFHDSGLGSSALAQSELGLNATKNASSHQSVYAPSVISSRAEASHKRLPPLPPEGRLGIPFICTICKKQVRYQRTKAWKKHIFDDILAYACPFAECAIAGAFFQDRDAMMDHLEQNHDLDVTVHRVTCPLCAEHSSDDRDALALHFSRHMEEIALAILPSGVDADDKSVSDASSEAETESEKHSNEEGTVSDQVIDPTTDISKVRLTPGTEVLYCDPGKRRSTEGEGFLCRVTSVIGEGKQRRYEIIDADPDPPTPAIPIRTSLKHLIPISPTNANTTLQNLDQGMNVLALYPGTTTFYMAVVVAGKEKDDNMVRLRFEGEDEADRDMSVESRYVLSAGED
ncbi:hypothetical protein CC86DRAFT_143902 [Ophiobolus disseminans]|uniref:SGF29 C-terminal domain-containing protein n=1 Tax=Ophiobolus disseminans TaxID=1469910 RepID=A0A6A7AGM0_9PLEO|nr:hypothetical protein CC86DRAFT_143902 [Ophiobolus disseminans]